MKKDQGLAAAAKYKALKDIRKKLMDDQAKGIQKVSVMAKDSEGLKKGLEKAEEILESSYECGGIHKKDGGYEDGGAMSKMDSDTKDYSHLEDMSKEELLEYIKKNY